MVLKILSTRHTTTPVDGQWAAFIHLVLWLYCLYLGERARWPRFYDFLRTSYRMFSLRKTVEQNMKKIELQVHGCPKFR